MEREVKLMKSRFKKMFRLVSLPLVLVLVAGLAGGSTGLVTAGHETWPETGMICTTNDSATFTLTTREGTISTPDGNVVYMWGYSEGADPFQHPSPVLCVNEGDTVTIALHNTLPEDVSLIFPGQDNVLANGEPSQPQFGAGGNLTSLAPVAAANGGTMTYSFVASKPGTYLYESGTETAKQVNMGLYGGLVVRPALHPDWAYNDVVVSGTMTITTQFNPAAEYFLVFSEIDPMLHMAVEQGLPYNMNNYRARYWMINGRSFPDTVAPNGAEWLPNQPYGSLLYIHPYDDDPGAGEAYNPYPALIRFINVGTENYPHHPHGNHGRIIAQDGNVLVGGGGEDMSYEKFTINLGPGQTYDELFVWTDVEQWDPVTNPIPVVIPQLQNLTFGTFYSGSPYLGNVDTLPVGHQALNACGEYYHIAHNHALQQITAWGIVLSGHITFTRIDPPLPNECQ
jgi:FtsP/CotA-like multicopper oxidase with cupredoxin domain